MMKKFLLPVLLMFSHNLLAAHFFIQVSLIHEIGTGDQMILKSELHALEEMKRNKKQVFKMQEGLRFEFSSDFIKEDSTYGPSASFIITGKVFNSHGDVVQEISGNEGIINIGEEKVYVNDSITGRRIEVRLLPEIR